MLKNEGMASHAIQALVSRAESSRRTLARWKEKSKMSEKRVISAGETIVGAVIGGAIDAKWGAPGVAADFGETGIPIVLVVGAASVVGGFFEFPGSDHLLAAGSGMLAYAAGDFARAKLGT